jgi:hypothetical protein
MAQADQKRAQQVMKRHDELATLAQAYEAVAKRYTKK